VAEVTVVTVSDDNGIADTKRNSEKTGVNYVRIRCRTRY